MKVFIYIALAIFLAIGCMSHDHGHSTVHPTAKTPNSVSAKTPNSVCHYTTTHGVEYDLRLLDHNAVSDLQYYDVLSASTFYFRPCGTVSSYHQITASGVNQCPAGSSVCMVNAAGKAVNFGTNGVVQWADGVEDHASIEAAYGNGEVCNNGASRKTFVEYVCNINKHVAATSIVNVTMIDDCTAKVIIESAYACPVANYCRSISTSESCTNQLSLCKWTFGKCVSAKACWGSYLMHASHGGLFAIVLITIAGILLACTCGLCLCACKRRRTLRKRGACRKSGAFRRTCRRSLNKKTSSKKQKTGEEDAEYAPFQMPFQLVPGGLAPINPYSNIQGYPMVTLVAPSDNHEQV